MLSWIFFFLLLTLSSFLFLFSFSFFFFFFLFLYWFDQPLKFVLFFFKYMNMFFPNYDGPLFKFDELFLSFMRFIQIRWVFQQILWTFLEVDESFWKLVAIMFDELFFFILDELFHQNCWSSSIQIDALLMKLFFKIRASFLNSLFFIYWDFSFSCLFFKSTLNWSSRPSGIERVILFASTRPAGIKRSILFFLHDWFFFPRHVH